MSRYLTKLLEDEIDALKRELEQARKTANAMTQWLYLLLQAKHRGKFTVTEKQLAEFGLSLAGTFAVRINADDRGTWEISVPPEERRAFIMDADDDPFFVPDGRNYPGGN